MKNEKCLQEKSLGMAECLLYEAYPDCVAGLFACIKEVVENDLDFFEVPIHHRAMGAKYPKYKQHINNVASNIWHEHPYTKNGKYKIVRSKKDCYILEPVNLDEVRGIESILKEENFNGVEEFKRKYVSKTCTLAVRASTFRSNVVNRDGCCVLTGAPPESCQAAHIVPVSEGGSDSETNGVMLRDDIHRSLFDSGYLKFCPCGSGEAITRFADNVPKSLLSYYKELNNKYVVFKGTDSTNPKFKENNDARDKIYRFEEKVVDSHNGRSRVLRRGKVRI